MLSWALIIRLKKNEACLFQADNISVELILQSYHRISYSSLLFFVRPIVLKPLVFIHAAQLFNQFELHLFGRLFIHQKKKKEGKIVLHLCKRKTRSRPDMNSFLVGHHRLFVMLTKEANSVQVNVELFLEQSSQLYCLAFDY